MKRYIASLLLPHGKTISIATAVIGLIWLMNVFRIDKPTEIDEGATIAPQGMHHFHSDFLRNKYPCDEALITEVYKPDRADGLESIAVLFTGDSACTTLKSLLWFLKSSKANWLSKDIILIYASNSSALVPTLDHVLSTELSTLRQALIFDIDSKYALGTYHIDIDGTNGLLPNQDWVNCFITEVRRAGIKETSIRTGWDSVVHRILDGDVGSAHSVLLNRLVPSFTVRVRYLNEVHNTYFIKGIEGTLRDGSNLHQQLHHSFTNYFFTTTKSHVAHGIFLIPLLLLIAPFLVFGIFKAPSDDFVYLMGIAALAVFVAGNFNLSTELFFGMFMKFACNAGDDFLVATGAVTGILLLAMLALHWSLALLLTMAFVLVFVSLKIGRHYAAWFWLILLASSVDSFLETKRDNWEMYSGVFYPVTTTARNFIRLVCTACVHIPISDLEIPSLKSTKLAVIVGLLATICAVVFGVHWRSVDSHGFQGWRFW